jgi:hypothetical protein
LALQVEDARTCAIGAGLPLTLPLALQVWVFDLQGPLGDIPTVVFALPTRIRLQSVDLNEGLFQNARQGHGAIATHVHLNLATRLVHLELDLCTLEARPRR